MCQIALHIHVYTDHSKGNGNTIINIHRLGLRSSHLPWAQGELTIQSKWGFCQQKVHGEKDTAHGNLRIKTQRGAVVPSLGFCEKLVAELDREHWPPVSSAPWLFFCVFVAFSTKGFGIVFAQVLWWVSIIILIKKRPAEGITSMWNNETIT